jgi:hypothetical protein
MHKALLVLLIVLFILVLIKNYLYTSEDEIYDDYIYDDSMPDMEFRCGGFDRPRVTSDRKKYKIVTSFTTSPGRISKTDKTLFSLKKQTYKPDNILVNIPKVFARTGEMYTIPEFIKNDKKIKINILDRDYGPATKLVGAILRIPKDADVWIVVHDDDQLYLQNTIDEYTKYIDENNGNKKMCYTLTGFRLDKNNNFSVFAENLEQIHVLEGFMTFCVHRSLFEDDFMPYLNTVLTNQEAFQSDDLILSNYIAKKKANIYMIYNENVNKNIWWSSRCELEYGMESDALHKMAKKEGDNDQLGGHYQKYLRVIEWLKEKDLYYLT